MLIVSLLTACTYKAYAASAAGVVVAGGSIGTGGAAAGLLGLMGPVVAILGVALAAYGITVVLDDSAESEGMTKSEFILDQATKYNQARDMSNTAMIDIILQGASVLKNGAISISKSASEYINGFINYLFGSDQIVNPDALVDTPIVTFAGIDLPVYYAGEHFYMGENRQDFYIRDNIEGRLFAGFRVGTHGGYFITNKSGVIRFTSNNVNDEASTFPIKSGLLYYTQVIYTPGCVFPNVLDYYDSRDAFINAIKASNDDFIVKESSDISTLVGDETIFNDRSGTLSPSADENTVFFPPLVGALPGTGSVNIPDYLDAIIDLLNDGATDIPIADPVTGVASPVAVTDIDLTDTVPAIDTVEEQAGVGSTAVVDPDVPLDPDVDTVNSLAFDLREIFPFCIPFDLYNLLTKFVAEPQAPYWEISIPMPMNLPALEFVIDFSDFESVGVVLRSFEMVLFVASLAVATRSIYLRG